MRALEHHLCAEIDRPHFWFLSLKSLSSSSSDVAEGDKPMSETLWIFYHDWLTMSLTAKSMFRLYLNYISRNGTVYTGFR